MSIAMEEHSEWVKKGKLFTFEMEMSTMPDKRRRTIRVWLPELYDGVRRFPVLYLHDGQYDVRELKKNFIKLEADYEIAVSALRKNSLKQLAVLKRLQEGGEGSVFLLPV